MLLRKFLGFSRLALKILPGVSWVSVNLPPCEKMGNMNIRKDLVRGSRYTVVLRALDLNEVENKPSPQSLLINCLAKGFLELDRSSTFHLFPNLATEVFLCLDSQVLEETNRNRHH